MKVKAITMKKVSEIEGKLDERNLTFTSDDGVVHKIEHSHYFGDFVFEINGELYCISRPGPRKHMFS